MGRVYIIAEAGVNHNGDVDIAKELIRKAKEAGADAVKFQTFIADELAAPDARTAEYQAKNIGAESQLEMLRKLEFNFQTFAELKEYSGKIGIDFLSTPFDLKSIDFLTKLELPFIKIPSGEITDKPYLVKIANTGLPVIISTGMSTMEEIREALQIFNLYPKNKLTLLHCTTEYPAPFSEINLRAMVKLKEAFGYPVGYSDHTTGIEVSIAAAALGAEVIEKHFTLDKTMKGPDHKASVEPQELQELVNAVRNIEKAMGDGEKTPSVSEHKNRNLVRKSIVASRDIVEGELFTEDNLGVKRPGDGISPMKWETVLGTVSPRRFKKDEKIEL